MSRSKESANDKTYNLADLFETVASVVSERTAFICVDQRLSFRDLDQCAFLLASALSVRGIVRGDNDPYLVYTCSTTGMPKG